MDEATQQNAALVEQAAAAAESLVEQANALTSAISVFQLDTGAAAATRVTATRAKPRLVSTQASAHPTAQPLMLLAKNGSNDGEWMAY
jgi:methyl-accepting chemotaxis protein